MKKYLLIISFSLTGAIIFSSCNKKIKEDISSLETQIQELASANAALVEANSNLQNNLNSQDAIFMDAPIEATTTYYDNEDKPVTVSGSYKYKYDLGEWSGTMIAWNDDSIYTIKLERAGDPDWYTGAWVRFYYDAKTKRVDYGYDWHGLGHSWDGLGNNYRTYVYYYGQWYNPIASCTYNVQSIDIVTGDISLTATANASGTYTNNTSIANPGKPASTTLSFTGKLQAYSYEDVSKLRMEKSDLKSKLQENHSF
jgi:hypothetical protein